MTRKDGQELVDYNANFFWLFRHFVQSNTMVTFHIKWVRLVFFNILN